ncbi:MAG: hypothetical protein A2Y62_00245 [Candidatus Fischerbacteria bacterium RBG_13_37_8]|uniref:D-lactate dehydrogenase (cytochrome) n=1 Tax=Candidatus Fischerbacteria bacterium RBG_13_37_8 TaxID=1817863 RepID=A0A1F5VRT1_9BACT|nr:MAG: hypothetical protein A2Y62_00245 [Candidatus Fischerbacteria bacterium RBG_13_37_8]
MKKFINDMRHSIKGTVLDDDLHRIMYSIDASILQEIPLCIIYPQNTDDVIKIVQLCSKHNIPLAARGAGTAMTGGSLLNGVILDFSKYMNKILELNHETNTVRLQPGITCTALNKILHAHKKFFPPDPSSGDFCTIGGMIANNSGGPHSVKYGSTKDHVFKLKAILSDSSLLETGIISCSNATSILTTSYPHSLAQSIATLFQNADNTIIEEKPDTLCNASGYNIFETITPSGIDLTKLITGSEGTLGIITEATLSIQDIPKTKGAAIAVFDDITKCGSAILACKTLEPSALELLDKKIIDILRKETPIGAKLLSDQAEALLIIEFMENEQTEVILKIASSEKEMINADCISFYKAFDEAEQNNLWKIRKMASPVLKRSFKETHSLEFIEDTAVSLKVLPEYILFLRQLFSFYHINAAIFGHAGKGNIHVNPEINIHNNSYGNFIHKVMDEVYDFVISKRGSISGEHGDGLIRAQHTYRQYPKLSQLMMKIKELFDPNGILNPGKVFGKSGDSFLNYLRYGKGRIISAILDNLPEDEISRCNGCGTCRSYCPVYEEVQEEAAAPRSKATVLRALITGDLDSGWFENSLYKKFIDSCFNCKLCWLYCPSGVDISGICIEARRAYVLKKGQTITNIVLMNEESLMKTGSKIPVLTNKLLSNSVAKYCAEKLFGIDARRDLPRVQSWSFDKYKSTFEGIKKVIYYPGCYARYHNLNELEASIALLEKHAIHVEIPPIACCGIAAFTMGDEDIEKVMKENLALLCHYIEEGSDIVVSSASCGLALRKEYLRYADSRIEELIFHRIYDIHEYIYKLYQDKQCTPRYKRLPMKIAFHTPCHLLVQGSSNQVLDMLKLVPGITFCTYEDTCCGMAGTFGMQKENFEVSMRIGSKLFTALREVNPEQIVTNCGTCKMQLELGLSRKVLHPVELLVAACELNGSD